MLTGTGAQENGHLDSFVGRRYYPSMPVDHAAAPGDSKIPDRVKLATAQGRVGPGVHLAVTPRPSSYPLGQRLGARGASRRSLNRVLG